MREFGKRNICIPNSVGGVSQYKFVLISDISSNVNLYQRSKVYTFKF